MSILKGSPERPRGGSKKTTVDKDLKRIVQLEKASSRVSQRYLNMGFGFLFLLAVWVFAYFQTGGVEVYSIVTVAALIGAYMAMNIGANTSPTMSDRRSGRKRSPWSAPCASPRYSRPPAP